MHASTAALICERDCGEKAAALVASDVVTPGTWVFGAATVTMGKRVQVMRFNYLHCNVRTRQMALD